MVFESIAIIGQSCLFPGVFSPVDLWRLSVEKRDSLSEVPENRWIVDPASIINNTTSGELDPDHTWTTRAGYIRGFKDRFDPEGFAIPAEEINKLGPVFQWPLHLAREALRQTHYDYQDLGRVQMGAIFANLSYPMHKLTELTLQTWLNQQVPELQHLFSSDNDWRNRFMSGFPALFLANALNLSGNAFTLDAACGSSTYALKLACRELQTRRADLMLAGGINVPDELSVLMSFTRLHALSKSGQSRPFDRRADGLVPTEGGGLFVLKRLDDAIRDRDAILGIIRGIGLSNDGHSPGMLVPTVAGQTLAMQKAYNTAGIDPKTISYIECHATGTPVGDGVEIRSMQQIFKDNEGLVLGALKANLGHALTASTCPALTRVLYAMHAGKLPPIKDLKDPIDELQQSNFITLSEPRKWQTLDNQPLRAAISGFGMGGTNCHLIVEQYLPDSSVKSKLFPLNQQETKALPLLSEHRNEDAVNKPERIAIVAMSGMVGSCIGIEAIWQHILSGQSLLKETEGLLQAKIEQIALPFGLRFPPNDLKEALGQHLAILHAGLAVMEQVKQPHLADRAGIFVGMGCDPEISRRSLRWFLTGLFAKQGITPSAQWLTQALDSITPLCKPAHILGAMPNVLASRLAMQWDCKGPCFAVCSEELSGLTALQIASDALHAGEIDMAVVGAVDMSCELVHQLAVKALLPKEKHIPSDAVVVLVLKRLSDARKENEQIIAILGDDSLAPSVSYAIDETQFIPLLGHAHAASGLLHVALAAMACHDQLLPAATGKHFPIPWIPFDDGPCTAQVKVHAFSGHTKSVFLAADLGATRKPFIMTKMPQLYYFSGHNRQEVIDALQNQVLSEKGPAKLVMIADDSASLQQKKQIALHLLASSQQNLTLSLPHHGIYYRDQPLQGDVAFVFASSNTSYPDMGIDLTLAFPEILEEMHQRYHNEQGVLNLLYGSPQTTDNFLTESLAADFLGGLHYRISREVLGIRMDCVLGHSLGESNALNAMDVFHDQDDMEKFAEKSELFTRLLDREYVALRQYYPNLHEDEIGWQNWRIHEDIDQVKKALVDEPYCHLTIINTPHDCVIAGIPQACQRIIKKLRPLGATKLKIDFMVHCPEVRAVAQTWYQLHHRVINPLDVRIYSCITGKPYPLTSDSVAEYMLKIGTEVVDFPKLIHNAWQDGARIFIEHGPQGLCSHWIKEILGKQDYIATHYDQPRRCSLTQTLHVIAELMAAGVNVNHKAFIDRVKNHG